MVRVITVDSEGFLYLVSRAEWLAREPKERRPVTQPFHRVHLSVTQTAECHNRAQCVTLLRQLQDRHMLEGSWDIRPSFLIGSYGTVYEGRGWSSQAEFLNPFNGGNLEIAFMGNFATNSPTLGPPPYEMYSSALSLVKYGLKNGFIRHDYRIAYHFPNKLPNYNAEEIPID